MNLAQNEEGGFSGSFLRIFANFLKKMNEPPHWQYCYARHSNNSVSHRILTKLYFYTTPRNNTKRLCAYLLLSVCTFVHVVESELLAIYGTYWF